MLVTILYRLARHIHMIKLSFLLIFLVCLASTAWSQADSARLRVRAVLVDKDLNQKPVPKLAFVLARFEGPVGESMAGKTGFDGNSELQLAPGKYRLSTPESVEFQGRKYSWDLEITVSAPESTIELSNDNAKVSEAATTAPSRKVDELTTLFQ